MLDASNESGSSIISSDEDVDVRLFIPSDEDVDVRLLGVTSSTGFYGEYHAPPSRRLKAMVRSAQESSFVASSSHHPSPMTTREVPGPSSLSSPGLDAWNGHNFSHPIPRQSYAPSRSQVRQTFTSGGGHSLGLGNGRAAQELLFTPQMLTSGGGHTLGVGSARAAQYAHFSPQTLTSGRGNPLGVGNGCAAQELQFSPQTFTRSGGYSLGVGNDRAAQELQFSSQTLTSGGGHSLGLGNGRAAQELQFTPQMLTRGGGHTLGVGNGRAAQELHFSPQTFTSGRGHSVGVGSVRAAQELHFSPQTFANGQGQSAGVGNGRAAQELHFSPVARVSSSQDAGKILYEGKVEGASTSSSETNGTYQSSSLSSGSDAEVHLVGVTATRNLALGDFASSSQRQQREARKPSTQWRDSLSFNDTLFIRDRGLRSYGGLAHDLGNCSPCIFQYRFDRGEVQFPCWKRMLCDRCHQPHDPTHFVRHRQKHR